MAGLVPLPHSECGGCGVRHPEAEVPLFQIGPLRLNGVVVTTDEVR